MRALPYAWTRSRIEQANQRGIRGLVYVHLRELDRRWMTTQHLPWRARLVMGWETPLGSIKDILKEETVIP